MNQETLVEALRQVDEGADIPSPASLLKNISLEKAAVQLPGMPYSILTNLAHALFWQEIWLNRLERKPAASFTRDWKVPEPEAWPEIRASFLAGMSKAMELASAKPFKHAMKSDEIACRTLLQIAIHNAYHLGQINLLKRGLRLQSTQT